jgi:hypothetical protein
MDHVAEMIEDLRYCRDVTTRAGERIDTLEAENKALKELLDRLKAKFDQPGGLHTYVKDIHSSHCGACAMRKWFHAAPKEAT